MTTTKETPDMDTNAIRWTCENCGMRIEPDHEDGAIELPTMAELRDVEAAHRQFEQTRDRSKPISFTSLLGLPALAHWRVVHNTCSTLGDTTAYDLTLKEARTHADLLKWTLHLMEKSWFQYTDWSGFIRRTMAWDR